MPSSSDKLETFFGGTSSYATQMRTVKLKVKVTLEQATRARRESRGIALLFP